MSQSLSIEAFQFRIQGLAVPVGLVIDDLTLGGTSANIETDPFGITLQQEGTMTALISESALAAFLRTKMSMVSDLRVTLAEDRLTIEATIRLIVELSGTAVAQLVIDDGQRILVVLESVEPAPLKSLLESQIAGFNPVFDAQDLPFHVRLTSLAIADGRIVLEGLARP